MNISVLPADRFRGTGCIPRLALPLFIASLLLAGCGERRAGQPRRVSAPPSDTFSIAFYNVENLFDNEFDGDEYVEFRPNATNWNREMHSRKFDNIASAIAAMNASIVSLCEVEDRDALYQLQKKLAEKGVRYKYRAIVGTPASSNTHPAILSRFPVERSTAHAVAIADGFPTRAILEAQFDIDGRPLTLFVNHWPSKHHPESYRMAAAKTLISRLAQLPRGTDYCIAGDLNSDYDEFSTFTTFGHNDTRDGTGINHCLGTIRTAGAVQMRPRTEREVIAAPFPSHYDLWLELDEKERMSYFYQGNRQTPDHILLPPALYDQTGISYLDNSFRAFTWAGKLLSHGKPARWKIRHQGGKKYHVGKGYSDHLPLIAHFTTGPFCFDTVSSGGRDTLSDDTMSMDGWFEYHTDGWIACGNGITLERDTLEPKAGRFALHVATRAQKKTGTVAKTVVRPSDRKNNGAVTFYLRGSGSICFRTRALTGKWRYHIPVDGASSGRAKYVPMEFPAWQSVTLNPSVPPEAPVELELRTGKDAPLDLRIDR
ncbi:MAG: hypothetical protein JW913_01695 [Chitinispirillaceae bacterium]|nr:hypothetical protein [Chitinispirillaceae bacterium]